MSLHVQLVGSGFGFAHTAKGSATPANATEAASFERLQRAINAFIAKFMPGRTPLTVDKILGASTLGARNDVYAHAAATTGVPAQPRGSIDDLANNALVDALFIEGATQIKLPVVPFVTSAIPPSLRPDAGPILLPPVMVSPSAPPKGPIATDEFTIQVPPSPGVAPKKKSNTGLIIGLIAGAAALTGLVVVIARR